MEIHSFYAFSMGSFPRPNQRGHGFALYLLLRRLAELRCFSSPEQMSAHPTCDFTGDRFLSLFLFVLFAFCHKTHQAPPSVPPPHSASLFGPDHVDLTLLVFVLQSAAMEETVIWEQHTVTLHRVSAAVLVRCLDQILRLGGSRW